MNLLLQLTLRGTLIGLLVVGLELTGERRVSTAVRRLWWVLVPLAFLVPWRIQLHVLPTASGGALTRLSPVLWSNEAASDFAALPAGANWPWLSVLWVSGAAVYLAILGVRTARIARQWGRERLCTEPGLTELLEDCKAALGVTAPIGLVVSDRIDTPAILGWLRPRIILPAATVRSLPTAQLRCVLLHELAHFRAADVPLNWLFSLAQAVHWFNPLVSWTNARWRAYQEAAADETVLGQLPVVDRPNYGAALLATVSDASGPVRPWGALGMSESMRTLKHRFQLIQAWRPKPARWFLSFAGALLLVSAILAQPVAKSEPANPIHTTVTAMQGWLGEIDRGNYEQSWKDAGTGFQQQVTQARWTAQLTQIRTPLGTCTSRKLLSAARNNNPRKADGTPLGVELIVARFDTAFTNMVGAVETVAFERDADGAWRASGYYIKPRTTPAAP